MLVSPPKKQRDPYCEPDCVMNPTSNKIEKKNKKIYRLTLFSYCNLIPEFIKPALNQKRETKKKILSLI